MAPPKSPGNGPFGLDNRTRLRSLKILSCSTERTDGDLRTVWRKIRSTFSSMSVHNVTTPLVLRTRLVLAPCWSQRRVGRSGCRSNVLVHWSWRSVFDHQSQRCAGPSVCWSNVLQHRVSWRVVLHTCAGDAVTAETGEMYSRVDTAGADAMKLAASAGAAIAADHGSSRDVLCFERRCCDHRKGWRSPQGAGVRHWGDALRHRCEALVRNVRPLALEWRILPALMHHSSPQGARDALHNRSWCGEAHCRR